MTLQEFQKTITKRNWLEKYYFYLISLAAIGGSIFLFYDIGINPLKYKSKHSYEIALAATSLLLLLGFYALYLISNRYKVVTIYNNSTFDRKQKLIAELLNKLEVHNVDTKGALYSFKYKRKWWTSDYDVYLYIDNDKFYISVLGRTHSYPTSGFIDFGDTEKLRKKIILIIESLAGENN